MSSLGSQDVDSLVPVMLALVLAEKTACLSIMTMQVGVVMFRFNLSPCYFMFL